MIASNETTIVSKPKGKGSNVGTPGIQPRFMTIHIKNHAQFTIKKAMLPNPVVNWSASRSASPRFSFSRDFRLLRIEAIVF
jgi:hypothetical protein